MRAILRRFKRQTAYQDTLERRPGAMDLWRRIKDGR